MEVLSCPDDATKASGSTTSGSPGDTSSTIIGPSDSTATCPVPVTVVVATP